jgi:UTP--glucose-1-phosphate uridylyltransferase
MRVDKAVVPIAGLGTRLFPASHACKKPFFPVVGRDGIVRPLIHYQILDLMEAGIEAICIVVGPGEDALVTDYLAGPGDAYLERLQDRPELLREAERMRSALDVVVFAVQEEPLGFGHAVLQSKGFAGGDPVLLCLGDHLFRAESGSCHDRLMRAYGVCGGRSISAVNRIGVDELRGYGTIAGRRWPNNPDIIDVTQIVEKPSEEVARAKLRVDGLGSDEFLGWFGMHVLAPSIYDILDEMVARDTGQRGEMELTAAQELQRQREGYCALEIRDSQRFDFGLPESYARSVARFALP